MNENKFYLHKKKHLDTSSKCLVDRNCSAIVADFFYVSCSAVIFSFSFDSPIFVNEQRKLLSCPTAGKQHLQSTHNITRRRRTSPSNTRKANLRRNFALLTSRVIGGDVPAARPPHPSALARLKVSTPVIQKRTPPENAPLPLIIYRNINTRLPGPARQPKYDNGTNI